MPAYTFLGYCEDEKYGDSFLIVNPLVILL